ncbi:hypothetical protein BaRGS_00009888 [Batillaria attramentaria]|uniref:Uncharacterized protein n=1 Tax=Batillaria attramentaria TaxID=370345 RepID=A0ABD0LHV9_9CAEN
MDFLDEDVTESPLQRSRKTEKREWQTFREKLLDFPHSFHMEDNHHKAAKGNLKQVLVRLQKGLESALSVGYKTALETARAKNYLAFILFCQGHHQEALDKTEEALSEEGEGQNLVALANRATILWRMEDRQEAEEEIRRLQILRNTTDFNYLKVKARAELAFCYSRLDPEFYTEAVRIFEEVLVEAQEPEKWLWTFGLGLTKRRLLSGQYAPMFGRERNLREDTFKALDLLLVVINKADSKNLRAKAHAEVAVLISYMTWDKQLKRDLAEKAGMGSREACNVALELDDSDNSVLCKTAKIFRKMRETQRSVDLLERALSIRESSTAYHHLGLAYKALASEKKREDLGVQVTPYWPRGGRERSSRGRGQGRGDWVARRLQTPRERRQGYAEMAGQESSRDNRSGPAARHSLDLEIYRKKKTAKSPPKPPLRLSRTDPFVTEAMECFEKAFSFSEGQNRFAKYDLALMHRYIGEPLRALKLLEEIRHSELESSHSTLLVSSFEQAGWILNEQSEAEEDHEKKEKLARRAQSMFNKALIKEVQLFSATPHLHEHIGKVWNSFSELLREAEESDLNDKEKLGEKARLFRFISDHNQVMVLLDEIKCIMKSPEEETDPEYLKLRIENYVDLKEFDNAVAFIKLLKCTAPGKATMDLFGDKHYVLKVYIQAAEHALLHNELVDSKEFFQLAFTETVTHTLPDGANTLACIQSSKSGENYFWDVMMFYDNEEPEKESERKAKILAGVLRDVCGLKVTLMDEDILTGSFEKAVVETMDRSRLVVVLPGPEEFDKELMPHLKEDSLRRQTKIVTLLTDCGRVPHCLTCRPSLTCPQELLTLDLKKVAVGGEEVEIIAEKLQNLSMSTVTEHAGSYPSVQAGAVTEHAGSYPTVQAGAVTEHAGSYPSVQAGAVTEHAGSYTSVQAGAVTEHVGSYPSVQAGAVTEHAGSYTTVQAGAVTEHAGSYPTVQAGAVTEHAGSYHTVQAGAVTEHAGSYPTVQAGAVTEHAGSYPTVQAEAVTEHAGSYPSVQAGAVTEHAGSYPSVQAGAVTEHAGSYPSVQAGAVTEHAGSYTSVQAGAGTEHAGSYTSVQAGAVTEHVGSYPSVQAEAGTAQAGEGTERAGRYSKPTIQAICTLFKFLVGIHQERPNVNT